jgi:hypothetical protein
MDVNHFIITNEEFTFNSVINEFLRIEKTRREDDLYFIRDIYKHYNKTSIFALKEEILRLFNNGFLLPKILAEKIQKGDSLSISCFVPNCDEQDKDYKVILNFISTFSSNYWEYCFEVKKKLFISESEVFYYLKLVENS